MGVWLKYQESKATWTPDGKKEETMTTARPVLLSIESQVVEGSTLPILNNLPGWTSPETAQLQAPWQAEALAGERDGHQHQHVGVFVEKYKL